MPDLVTSVLDLVGMILIVASVAVLIGSYAVWAGLAVGGACLLVVSWLVHELARRRVA